MIKRVSSLRVSRKLVMKKLLSTYQGIAPSEGRVESIEFKASRGWLEKDLSLGRKTSVAQKDPDKLIC